MRPEAKKFPRLFKKTSTGAIQFWDVEADFDYIADKETHDENVIGLIQTTYGQVGTDSPQKTLDVIGEGKNIGRANETTAFQQACLEAKSKWEKQLKKNYVKTIEEAEAGKVDEIIEGGIDPMLAHKYRDHAKKITYPAFLQRKYDGHRMICVVKKGKATLWSRTKKPIRSLPHIIAEIEAAFPDGDFVLDGEGYNDKFSKDFEHITHLIRQDQPDPQHVDVEYHVYDMAISGSFVERFKKLKEIVEIGGFKYIKLAPTELVQNEEEALDRFVAFLNEGMEGAMIRNAHSLYVNKRSYDLQKIKEMVDDEFEIVGIEEGRGKLAGHAIFVCRTKEGQEFKAKMKGDTAKLKAYFNNHSLWQGKFLTVQYQNISQYGVPRFPVGLRICEKL